MTTENAENNETITISLKKYNQLVSDSLFLNALMAAGVDNWEGYSEACVAVDSDDE